MQDFLITRGGHGVAGMGIEFDLYLNRPAIIDYRVVQETPTRLRVSLVVDPNFPPIDPVDVQTTLRRKLGDVAIAVEFVKEIPRDPSGKRRRVYRVFDLPAELSGNSMSIL